MNLYFHYIDYSLTGQVLLAVFFGKFLNNNKQNLRISVFFFALIKKF